MGIFSGIKNVLFGKKEKPGFAPIDPAVAAQQKLARDVQSRGLRGLVSAHGEPVEDVVRGQIKRDIRAKKGAEADALRDIEGKVARRGLGKSSIGLGVSSALKQRTAEDISRTRESLPERLRNLRIGRARELLGAGSTALGARGVQRKFNEGGRKGGLAPALGMAAGGIIGAKTGVGAKTGAQIGGAFGTGTQALVT